MNMLFGYLVVQWNIWVIFKTIVLETVVRSVLISDENYIFKARQELEQQEDLLEKDLKRGIVTYDKHWDGEHIRKSLHQDENQDL